MLYHLEISGLDITSRSKFRKAGLLYVKWGRESNLYVEVRAKVPKLFLHVHILDERNISMMLQQTFV